MKALMMFLLFVFALPMQAAEKAGQSEPEMAAGVARLQHEWARIQYQLPESEREKAFEKRVSEATEIVQTFPGKAEPLIWQGIVLSTYAGARGGLGALGLVKDARASLQAALDINPEALDGSAYTSLGSLYYQVPGWPLSFGDDEQAENYLRKALEINPHGIDANYFYGDFLMDQGEPERAQAYLSKALKSPAREGREVADAGRRKEAQRLLDTL